MMEYTVILQDDKYGIVVVETIVADTQNMAARAILATTNLPELRVVAVFEGRPLPVDLEKA